MAKRPLQERMEQDLQRSQSITKPTRSSSEAAMASGIASTTATMNEVRKEINKASNKSTELLTDIVNTGEYSGDLLGRIDTTLISIDTVLDNFSEEQDKHQKHLAELIKRFTDNSKDTGYDIKAELIHGLKEISQKLGVVNNTISSTGGSGPGGGTNRKDRRRQLQEKHKQRVRDRSDAEVSAQAEMEFGANRTSSGGKYKYATDEAMNKLSDKERAELSKKQLTPSQIKARAAADVDNAKGSGAGFFQRISSKLEANRTMGGLKGFGSSMLLQTGSSTAGLLEAMDKAIPLYDARKKASATLDRAMGKDTEGERRQTLIRERSRVLERENTPRAIFERQTEDKRKRDMMSVANAPQGTQGSALQTKNPVTEAVKQSGKVARDAGAKSLDVLKSISAGIKKQIDISQIMTVMFPIIGSMLGGIKGILGSVLAGITSLGGKLMGKALDKAKDALSGSNGEGIDYDKDGKKKDKSKDGKDGKNGKDTSRKASKPNTPDIDIDLDLPENESDSGKSDKSSKGKSGDTGSKGKGKGGKFKKWGDKFTKVFKRVPMLKIIGKKLPGILAKRALTGAIPVVGPAIAVALTLSDVYDIYGEAKDAGLIKAPEVDLPNILGLESSTKGKDLALTDKVDQSTMKTQKAIKEQERLSNASNNTIVNGGNVVNNTSSNTINQGSPFRFDNSHYQTSHNRGSVIIR